MDWILPVTMRSGVVKKLKSSDKMTTMLERTMTVRIVRLPATKVLRDAVLERARRDFLMRVRPW